MRTSMMCEFCGGTTAKKNVKKQHWLKGNLYIVENVEAEVCSQCGEKYFHAKTLEKTDHRSRRPGDGEGCSAK